MYVWTAGWAQAGYLPEMDPQAFRTRLEAVQWMVEELRAVDGGPDDDRGAERREELATFLEEHDGDVDGDWTGHDGAVAYWVECVDLPDDEARELLDD